MDAKQTYIFFLPFIACLVASCTSDAPDNENTGKGSEMSFVVSDLSRASETAIPFNEFAVYGDMSSKNIGTMVVFNKTNVVRDENNKWCYEGTQYWFPGFEHSFVAITPVSVLETDNNPQYSDSQLSFTYTLPSADYTQTADILAATHRRQYTSGTANAVSLRFSHLMSLINIAPAFYDNTMSSDEYILIHKLELSGIKSKAKFSILPAPRLFNTQTDDMTVDVNTQEEGNIAIEFPTPVKVENNAKNISLFANNDAIIMFPQAFADNSEAKITLFYSMNEEESITQDYVMLRSQTWESGKSYLYKFTIEMSGLKLNNCEINSWNVIKGDDITVD